MMIWWFFTPPRNGSCFTWYIVRPITHIPAGGVRLYPMCWLCLKWAPYNSEDDTHPRSIAVRIDTNLPYSVSLYVSVLGCFDPRRRESANETLSAMHAETSYGRVTSRATFTFCVRTSLGLLLVPYHGGCRLRNVSHGVCHLTITRNNSITRVLRGYLPD